MPRKCLVCLTIAALLTAVPSAHAANRLYEKYLAANASWTTSGLSGPVNVAVDSIKIAAVTNVYVPNSVTHQYFSSVITSVVGTPVTLTYASSVAGVYKSSNNPAFSVPAATTITYLVIYKDTGSPSTSPLMAILDTGAGLPYTSGVSTTTVNITMNPAGWFKL